MSIILVKNFAILNKILNFVIINKKLKDMKGTVDLLLKNGMSIEILISQAKHAIDNNVNVEMNLEIISYLRGLKLQSLLN